jgi:hypothetical protein
VAKQEAFEEKSRLKNQFRSLDEDEVEFLDSVLESTRAQEAAVKKDTADQLEAFRRQREQAEKALLGPTSSEVVGTEEDKEDWTAPARKRRREKQTGALISKKRKPSVSANPAGKDTQKGPDSQKQGNNSSDRKTLDQKMSTSSQPTQNQTKTEAKPTPKPLVSLGLGDYSSDSD